MINRISTTSHGRWIYLIAAPALITAMAVGCASPQQEKTQPIDTAIESTEKTEAIENPTETSDSTVKLTENMVVDENNIAKFPGGQDELYDFIAKNLTYPETAINDSVSGTVIVAFIIAPDGSMKNLHIKQSVRKDLDEATLNVLKKMPKWCPAPSGKDSEEVSMPLRFQLKERSGTLPSSNNL